MNIRERISDIYKRTTTAVSVFSGYLAAYASTDTARKIFSGWKPRPATANQALVPTLTTLVAQCRHLDRTCAEARAVVDGLTADVVGSGIDILPNTGNAELDLKILAAWHNFCECATVDGAPLWEWQAAAFRDMIVAGASLDRLLLLTERLDRGQIPLCILPLEVEWMSEMPVAGIAEGNAYIRGVEVDKYGRAVFFHLRNPEYFINILGGERVPASEIMHAYEGRRKQQVHGEPIMAPAVERLLQIDRLIRAELQASVNSAAPALVITANVHQNTPDATTGEQVTDIPGGAVTRLIPGETIDSFAPNRPNLLLAPFYDSMVGGVAAATHCSKSWITRDFSSTTFMNARFEQQNSQRGLASLKSVAGRMLAGRVYEAAFDWLLIQVGQPKPTDSVELAKLRRYEIRPDCPPYVDPVKDVAASSNAIANNLSTYDHELSQRGKDYLQVFEQRKRENDLLVASGLPLPNILSGKSNNAADPEFDKKVNANDDQIPDDQNA